MFRYIHHVKISSLFDVLILRTNKLQSRFLMRGRAGKQQTAKWLRVKKTGLEFDLSDDSDA